MITDNNERPFRVTAWTLGVSRGFTRPASALGYVRVHEGRVQITQATSPNSVKRLTVEELAWLAGEDSRPGGADRQEGGRVAEQEENPVAERLRKLNEEYDKQVNG